jgi:hypothetical protein
MNGTFVCVTANNARMLPENRRKQKCVKLKWEQIKYFSLETLCRPHFYSLLYQYAGTPPPPHTTPAPQTQPELATSRRQEGDELVSAFCSGFAGLPMCEGRINNYQTFVEQWMCLGNTARSTRIFPEDGGISILRNVGN